MQFFKKTRYFYYAYLLLGLHAPLDALSINFSMVKEIYLPQLNKIQSFYKESLQHLNSSYLFKEKIFSNKEKVILIISTSLIFSWIIHKKRQKNTEKKNEIKTNTEKLTIGQNESKNQNSEIPDQTLEFEKIIMMFDEIFQEIEKNKLSDSFIESLQKTNLITVNTSDNRPTFTIKNTNLMHTINAQILNFAFKHDNPDIFDIIYCNYPKLITARNKRTGNSYLLRAINKEKKNIYLYLIKNHPTLINLPNNKGITPLIYAKDLNIRAYTQMNNITESYLTNFQEIDE